MLLNNCWFCAAFFANFCEDFKSEINKVDEQKRFVITKGNEAG